MIRRSAILLAVALLAGCTYDRPDVALPATVTVTSQPAVSGATPLGALPGSPPPAGGVGQPGDPYAPPATAAAPRATTAGTPADGVPKTQPARTAQPGHGRPPKEALRVAWIDATVTGGGSGPCHTLKAADGVVWSTWAAQTVSLSSGAHVRARITPGSIPDDCGAGRPARLERVQLAG